MTPSDKKIYFANLDALRFIAASMVIIFHLEHKKELLDLDSAWNFLSFNMLGGFAVTIFFTLSGFLISYLLLKEKEASAKKFGIGEIEVRKFYIRRILRIWPLYYLIVFTGFFLWPNIDLFYIPEMSKLWKHLYTPIGYISYFFFMPNVAFARFGNIPYIDQTWSIGVEEQFYIFWPLLFTAINRKMVMWLALLTIIFLGIKFYFFGMADSSPGLSKLYNLIYISRFSCMAIGGIAAVILLRRNKFQKQLAFIGKKWIQLSSMVIIIAFSFTGLHKFFPVVDHEIFSLFVAIALINLSQPDVSIINFKNKGILYLGKISYGLYMYHNVVIVFSIWLIAKVLKFEHYNLPLYICAFALTVGVSVLSYELFEKHFLKLKERFTVIKSGNVSSN